MAADLSGITESRPIRDIAYECLKRGIITGEIPAGSRIVETTYAEQLHISRTPLREALRKLERDGLVEYVLRRGVIVRAFTINDIEEIFDIRNAVVVLLLPAIIQKATEADIAQLRAILSEMDGAQEKCDADALAVLNRRFHSTLERISGKLRVLRVIDSQEEYIMRFSHIAIASVVRRSGAHREHYQMVDLIEARDLEGLKKLMAHHYNESKETCLKAVANRGF